MKISPTNAALGAEIGGLDLSRTESLDAGALRRAWLDRGVLLFRGQAMTAEALARFGALFGSLEPPPASEAGTREELGDRPVWYISNVVEDGRPIGSLGAGEAEWHTDMSYLPEPPSASVLFAREVPAEGGDTSFADMEAAWSALDRDLRAAIAGRAIRHDGSTTSVGETRRGYEAVGDAREAPGADHPAARTHPETGRKSLYLGRRRHAWIVGLPLDESEDLLDRLWAHCRDPAFAWTHVWRAGDVAMWDNRRAIHRRDPFDPSGRRVMLRAQVKGDRPF